MPTGNSRKPKKNRRAVEISVNQAFSAIGKDLKRKGISLKHLIKSGREIRAKLLKEEYGLTEEDLA